ncbi:MAG: class I SAM-dependent methyltransferase [Acidiferrobacteraceae bacterium]
MFRKTPTSDPPGGSSARPGLPDHLPPPDPDELATSDALNRRILADIAAHDGFIDFARFMELALYAPGLGYYTAPARIAGITRDFVTAPDLSPLFGRCIANFCRSLLTQLRGGTVLEAGAGSGSLAVALLSTLAAQGPLPERYLILEVSPSLRAHQRQVIATALPELLPRVSWVEEIPDGLRGVILGNELLDALPCARFARHQGEFRTLGVTAGHGRLSWALGDVLPEAHARIPEARAEGYVSELPLMAERWVANAASRLAAGALLLVDYGFPRHEYYHPDRHQGTLMCHYRHRTHDNPLILAGLQDITVHLDFTGLAEAGTGAGLRLAGYATQAAFLLDLGLLDGVEQEPDERERRRRVHESKLLTLPSEMGELFKVIAFVRGLPGPLPGFGLKDLRGRL